MEAAEIKIRLRKIIIPPLFILLTAIPAYARYSGGTGTPDHQYRIATPDDLNDIRNHTHDYLKLFGRIKHDAFITNLGIEGVNIAAGDDSCYIADLCEENLGRISRCSVKIAIKSGENSFYLGGLCGYNMGTIICCRNTFSLAGGSSLGRLSGKNVAGIQNPARSAALQVLAVSAI